jgi:hypothetical protein
MTLLFCFGIQAQNKVAKDFEEQYVSALFRNRDAHSFVPSEDVSGYFSLTVFQYLQGKVAGLQIYGNPFSPFISYRSGRPALFINEIRADAEVLSSISMSDVALIKVYRPPFLRSVSGGNGAIAVYIKCGEEE